MNGSIARQISIDIIIIIVNKKIGKTNTSDIDCKISIVVIHITVNKRGKIITDIIVKVFMPSVVVHPGHSGRKKIFFGPGSGKSSPFGSIALEMHISVNA
jgi:hypothetical protein